MRFKISRIQSFYETGTFTYIGSSNHSTQLSMLSNHSFPSSQDTCSTPLYHNSNFARRRKGPIASKRMYDESGVGTIDTSPTSTL